MNISFHNGVSGMLAYQEDMNQIAHNVANAGTVGYKPSRSVFQDLLYTRMAVNSEEEPLVGHGVRVADNHLVYRQGPLLQNGAGGLDFALVGDGFFAVELVDGSIQYTRNGSFNISIEPAVDDAGAPILKDGEPLYQGFLVDEEGNHVLDSEGKRIELPRLKGDDGLFDLKGLKDRLGIYDFPNPYGLEHQSGVRFTANEVSGEAVAIIKGTETGDYHGRSYSIIENALEQSAVELSTEMVDAIVSQRAFQINAKMVQTADELEQVINNLR